MPKTNFTNSHFSLGLATQNAVFLSTKDGKGTQEMPCSRQHALTKILSFKMVYHIPKYIVPRLGLLAFGHLPNTITFTSFVLTEVP